MGKLIDDTVGRLFPHCILLGTEIRDILAPLAEAVECLEMIAMLAPVGFSIYDDGDSANSSERWFVETVQSPGPCYGRTLYKALRKAVEAKRASGWEDVDNP